MIFQTRFSLKDSIAKFDSSCYDENERTGVCLMKKKFERIIWSARAGYSGSRSKIEKMWEYKRKYRKEGQE